MGSDDGRKPRRSKKTTRSTAPEVGEAIQKEPTQGSQTSGNDGSHASSESTGNSILKQMNLNTHRKKSRSSKPEPKSSPKYTYMVVIIMCLWVVYYAGTTFMNNVDMELGADTTDSSAELKKGADKTLVEKNNTSTLASDKTLNEDTVVSGAQSQAKTDEETEASLWDGLLTPTSEISEVQNQGTIPNDKDNPAIDKMSDVSSESGADRKTSGLSVDDATSDSPIGESSNTKIRGESLTEAITEKINSGVTKSKGEGTRAEGNKSRPVAFDEDGTKLPQGTGLSKMPPAEGNQDEVGILSLEDNEEIKERDVTFQGNNEALSLDDRQNSALNTQQDGEVDTVLQNSDGQPEHGGKNNLQAANSDQESVRQESHQQDESETISQDRDGQMSTTSTGKVVSHPADNKMEQRSTKLTLSNGMQDEADETTIQRKDDPNVQKKSYKAKPRNVALRGSQNRDEHDGASEMMSKDSTSANVQNRNGKIMDQYESEGEGVQVLSQHEQQDVEGESDHVLSDGVDPMTGNDTMISYNDNDSTLPQNSQLDENSEQLSEDVSSQSEKQGEERGGDGQISEVGENEIISTDSDSQVDQGIVPQRGSIVSQLQKQVDDLQQYDAEDGKSNQMLSQDDKGEPRQDRDKQPHASKRDESDENTSMPNGRHMSQSGNHILQKQLQDNNQIMQPIGMASKEVRLHAIPQKEMSQSNRDLVNHEENPNQFIMSDNPKDFTSDEITEKDLQQHQGLKEEYDNESVVQTPTGQLLTPTKVDQIQQGVTSGSDEQFEAQHQPSMDMEMNDHSNSKEFTDGQQRVESQNIIDEQRIQSNDQEGSMNGFRKSNDNFQEDSQQKPSIGNPIQQSGKAKENKMVQNQDSLSLTKGMDLAESDVTEQEVDRMQQMDNQYSDENSNRRRLSMHHRSHIPPALDVQIEEYVQNHVLFKNLVNVDQDLPFQESNQVPYFWHIHKSGGSTLKHLMVCLERVQTRRMTLPECNDNEDTIHTCKLEWGTVVNADASSPEGIERINKLGLLRENIPNLVIDTSRVFEALSILSEERRGRLFIVMRDPVERAISKYYYTKIATWERNWHPEIVNMTMIEFANSRYCYDNWVTRRLVNKMTPGTLLTPEDLAIAKEILRQKALILLTNDMSQSSDRMVKFFGWPTTEYQEWCINKFAVEEPINTNPHPIPDQNSPEWQAISTKNFFDVELYTYALQLFDAQSRLVEELISFESPMNSIPNRVFTTQTGKVQQQIGWTTKSIESQLAPQMGQGKLTQQFMEERSGNPQVITPQENVSWQQPGVMLEGSQIVKDKHDFNPGVDHGALRQQKNADSNIREGQRTAIMETDLQQELKMTPGDGSSQTASQISPVFMQQKQKTLQQTNQPLQSMRNGNQWIQQQQVKQQDNSGFINHNQQVNQNIPEQPQQKQVQYNSPYRNEVH